MSSSSTVVQPLASSTSSSSSSPPSPYASSLLDQVKLNASLAWSKLTPAQRLDKTFILAAIQQSPTLPCKSDFERTFPQSLRFDRTIVLSFAKRDDFCELYHERHLFVPECCTDDFEIMLEYCKKIPRSLQDVKWDSLPKKHVRDLIRAALLLDGMELQYVPLEYQEEFFEFAILQNGKAVRLCPSPTLMEKVAASRDIMLKVVASCGSMLKRASHALQQDEEVVLTAVCQGGLDFKFIPKLFQSKVSFLQQAILQRADLYLQLSSRSTLQSNLTLCLAAVLSRTSKPEVQISALAHQKEAIWQNREAVLAMAQRGDIDMFAETLHGMLNNASTNPHHFALAQSYVNDLQIVKAAVEHNGKLLFTLVAEPLRLEVELILSSIQQDTAWNTLRCIPQTLQIQHPEITQKAIEVVSAKNLNALPNHIPEALWMSHRPLIQAWIRRGAPILFVFNNLVSNDVELALELAKYNWQEFRIVSPVLLSDRDFMLKAVQQDGRVLQFAPISLKQDFRLAVFAVANQMETLRCMATTTLNVNGSNNNDNDVASSSTTASIAPTKVTWIKLFRQHVTSQLDLYQMFVTDFLRGICCTWDSNDSRKMLPPAKRCPLQLLDRGTETTQAWKRLIAVYLGVPLGLELKLLRTCLTYLQQYNDRMHSSPVPDSTAINNNNNNTAAVRAMAHYHHHQQRHRFAAAAQRVAADHALVRWRFAAAAAAVPPAEAIRGGAGVVVLGGGGGQDDGNFAMWDRLRDPLEPRAPPAAADANPLENGPFWDWNLFRDDPFEIVADAADVAAAEGQVAVHRALRMAQQAMRALDVVHNRMEEELFMMEELDPAPVEFDEPNHHRHLVDLVLDEEDDEEDMLWEE